MARYRRVPLDQLTVDPSYQRELDTNRVQKIVDDFDPALLGALEISVRNGKCAVFDGQHRLEALTIRGEKDAPCLVHEGLTVPEEAMLFVRLQTQRKQLNPIDRFRARLRAGETQAAEIQNTVEGFGYTLGKGGHENQIGAISALDRVYDRGGRDLLALTLDLLYIWKGEPRSMDGALIEGMAIAITKYGDDKRWENIRTELEQITAASVLRKAIAALESGGGSASRPQAVAKQFGRLVGIRGTYKKRQKVTADA